MQCDHIIARAAMETSEENHLAIEYLNRVLIVLIVRFSSCYNLDMWPELAAPSGSCGFQHVKRLVIIEI